MLNNPVKAKKSNRLLNIGIEASFTANCRLIFVGAPLVEAGLAPSIELGPYNQLFSGLSWITRAIFIPTLMSLILLFRLEDFTLDDLLAFLARRRDTALSVQLVKKSTFLSHATEITRQL